MAWDRGRHCKKGRIRGTYSSEAIVGAAQTHDKERFHKFLHGPTSFDSNKVGISEFAAGMVDRIHHRRSLELFK